MFDSAPPNLPVEPGSAPAPAAPAPVSPPAPPSVPPSQPAPAPSAKPLSKKEPEDIFAGLDTGGEAPQEEVMGLEPERRRSPLTFLLVGLLIVLLVAAAGAGIWYFFIREKPVAPVTTPTVSPNPPVVTSDSEPVIETPPPQPPDDTTPPPNLPPPQSITPTTSAPPVTPSPVVLVEAADTDADGISDPEEAVLGTDATMPDSDGDGFSDSSELANGYDPAAAKLTLAVSPRFKLAQIGSSLSVLLPAAWTVGADVTTPGDISIQTGTPTSFSVHLGARPETQTFLAWLGVNEPTQDAGTLRSMTTRSGYNGYLTPDGLRAYIEIPGGVVVVAYHPNAATAYDFRALFTYVVQNIHSP
jgi:hypothetical protein